MKTSHFVRAAGAFVVCIVSVGCSCASKADLESLSSDLRREISAVSSEAQQASRNASDAQKVADEANSRSKRTEEAVNRGFQKSMRK